MKSHRQGGFFLRWVLAAGTSGEDWAAVRPSSPASRLLQRAWYIRENQVGCQAVIAGKPAPTKGVVHPRESGRLSGRHRWQASSYKGRGTSARIRSVVRPPSPASRLLQRAWYIRENQVGSQAAIVGTPPAASRLLQRAWYIRENQVGCQAAIAGKPAPTGDRVCFRFSPLIRPSVSSPYAFDFDLPAPSGG